MEIEVELKKISDLLEESIENYKTDRALAKKNYENLNEQLNEIHNEGLPMSEEGALEKSVNKALDIYIRSGARLEKVLDIASKMFNNQINNRTRLLVADKFIDGNTNKQITEPVDFKKLVDN